ncbi:NUDIX domain-containing protein [Streptomyces sp. NPDC046976]|uniref:NUDIX hydrolase n=1 Tax=Streptomyces sp. NPDC046976 TaxID=3155258 RepID=UPI0033CC909C
MGRRDYEDDPDAPVANSLVPAASAVVVDDCGRILLQRRRDNGMWALPGGAMHIGESLPDCAVRETREETGFDVEIVGIVGTYSNPRHIFAYDDGEVRQEFSVCFLARPTAGRLAVSEESTDVRWFRPEEVDSLPMVPAIRKRVHDWREGTMPAAR